jgi:Tfp pilus assembly protein PilO
MLILILRPALIRSANHLVRISEEEQKYIELNAELDRYIEDKEQYYLLNAEYQKLIMEFPDEDDVLILTNELYDIGKFTEVEINSLSFTDVGIEEGELRNAPVKEIGIDLVFEGSYYSILNFINTIEIMPRIMKVENVIIQSPANDYTKLLAFVTARTFFKNEYYRQ